MPTLPDQQARERALDINRSFAVSAPAGSGKTGLLTQRILALLAKCQQPEHVLAITFTNKAALEMRSRVLDALEQAKIQPTEPEEAYKKVTWELAHQVLRQDEAHEWNLLETPSRLKITTIDSFCREITQYTSLNHSLGLSPEIIDQPQYAYRLAAKETLTYLEKNHPFKDSLISLVKHFNNQIDTVEKLFIDLLEKREQWLPLIFQTQNQRVVLENVLQTTIESQLEKTRKTLSPIASDLAELLDYSAKQLIKSHSKSLITCCEGVTQLPDKAFSQLEKWMAICELLLTKKDNEIRKSFTKTVGFPAPKEKGISKEEAEIRASQKHKIEGISQFLLDNPSIIEALNEIRHLPSANYSEEQWQLLQSLTGVLTLLAAQLKVIFRQLGKTDFTEITLSALETLGNEEAPTDLALLMDYKIQHILIDEFQDTSAIQLALLKKLTQEWQKNDGRTLFIVGDAMQSCYSFRNANVGIFLELRTKGLENVDILPLDLTVNFRSDPKLIAWYNATFSKVFPAYNNHNEGAVKYLHADSVNTPLTQHAIQATISTAERIEDARKLEAINISSHINTLRQEKPTSSIAILVRSKNQAKDIIEILKKENINYNAIDIDRFDTNRTIQELLILTRALLFLDDRIAWLSFLRATWCAIDMHDLYALTHYCDNKTTTTLCDLLLHWQDYPTAHDLLSDKGLQQVNGIEKSLNQCFDFFYRYTPSKWIYQCWLLLGGKSLSLDSHDETLVKEFINHLANYEQSQLIENWDTFTQSLESLFVSNTKNHTDKEQKPVQIMTIHKSKGLEFDYVFIPGLERRARQDDPQLIAWQEKINHDNKLELLISPIHPTGNETDSIYSHIRHTLQKKQLHESSRLLYVGCTRAIQTLFLSGAVVKEDDELKIPKNANYLATLWDSIKNEANILEEPNNEVEINKSSNNTILRRIYSEQAAPTDPQYLSKYRLSFPINDLNKNLPDYDFLINKQERVVGIFTHEYLKTITEEGIEHWPTTRIQEQENKIFRKVINSGIHKDEATLIVETILRGLTSTVQSSTGQWLLDNHHKDSACELSLWSTIRGVIKESIIDRTFIEKSNDKETRWIIDYKTSLPKEDTNLDRFFEEQALRYSPQLQRYKNLFSDENHLINTALYYPLIDKLLEIDIN